LQGITGEQAEELTSLQKENEELRTAVRALKERIDATERELSGLLEVSGNLASQLELRPLLQLVIEQVQVVADYGRASLYLRQGDMLQLLASHLTRPEVHSAPPSYSMSVANLGLLWDVVVRGEAVLIDDVHTDTVYLGDMREKMGDLYYEAVANVHSHMIVPLAHKDAILGMLTLTHEKPAFYTDHHARLVTAIGTQAAIAIENARLFEHAQQLAALEERQRLARELHDSVSQALYGMALGARTARMLIEEDPGKAREPLDYVLSLAEAGQAEMRALIFELRPESLEKEGLVIALQKQVDVAASRYGIAMTTAFPPEPDLPIAEKEVFYRVSQEAVHNMVKHARALSASVVLTLDGSELCLEIADDGVGFDTNSSFPGHMGLVSMAERARNIGAVLTVTSAPGAGTRVRLTRFLS
jgi:signal transduction histidine kinase